MHGQLYHDQLDAWKGYLMGSLGIKYGHSRMHQVFLGCVSGRAVRGCTLALYGVTNTGTHQRQSVRTRRTHTYIATEHLNQVNQRYGS